MNRQPTLLLVGVLVVLLVGAGVSWSSVRRGWVDGSSATCSTGATVQLQGREYAWWDAVRVPQPAGPLGSVDPPDCYQGGGRFDAYEISGVDPEVAILVWSPDGLSVWLGPGYRTGERPLPNTVGVLGLPVACTMESPMHLIAVLRSANPPLGAGSRVPYTLGLQVSGAGIGYSSDALVTPQVMVTEQTRVRSTPLQLRSRMYEFADGSADPQKLSVTVHCAGDSWVADRIAPR